MDIVSKTHFNPHHPRGWRPGEDKVNRLVYEFQSTPPSRVATKDDPIPAARGMISIHTTLAGGDYTSAEQVPLDKLFQSTPPSRVATVTFKGSSRPRKYFNPHHPRGWRLRRDGAFGRYRRISIHTTLAGGDPQEPAPEQEAAPISIHTTLAGGDLHLPIHWHTPDHFNPHHPRGWRQRQGVVPYEGIEFQSTPPSRVATTSF